LKTVRWKAFARTPAKDTKSEYFAKSDFSMQMLEGNGHFYRKRLGNFQSKYQNIQVWETDTNEPIEPGQAPDRILYLDGVVQSSTDDEIIYHEHLVHPAMLVHPTGAKKVAILGGGEGATLREVLRHSTVTEAAMIELDDGVVEESKKYLKQMNNCSFGVPGYKSCFDDPRTNLVLEDCVKWFEKRFKGDACDGKANSSKFDVIIMDLLDPECGFPAIIVTTIFTCCASVACPSSLTHARHTRQVLGSADQKDCMRPQRRRGLCGPDRRESGADERPERCSTWRKQ
jgi:spermidine synthase